MRGLVGRLAVARRTPMRGNALYSKLAFIMANSIRRCGGHARLGTCVRDRNNGIAKDMDGDAGCLVGGSTTSRDSGGGGTRRLGVPVVARSRFIRGFKWGRVP